MAISFHKPKSYFNFAKVKLSVVLIFLTFSLYAQNGITIQGITFGVGGASYIQQNQFNHFDNSGVSDFSYKKRLQWQFDLRSRWYSNGRWMFGLATGLRQAGWNRVNNNPNLEPYISKINYSFLYSFVDINAGRVVSLRVTRLFLVAGITQYIRTSAQQTLNYSNGQNATNEESDIQPNKFSTAYYTGAEYRILMGNNLVFSIDYKFQVGSPKFHSNILSGVQVHHSLGLCIYLCSLR